MTTDRQAICNSDINSHLKTPFQAQSNRQMGEVAKFQSLLHSLK